MMGVVVFGGEGGRSLVVFWGITLAVAAFTLAIPAEADDWFAVITPILGSSILVGVVVHMLRLWSPTKVPVTAHLAA